jgi:ATP/maltotriose-dependent transcriptional regulator MalT
LELRHTEPGELPALHGAAARWHAQHGHPAEAVRHAQAAQDGGLAARLLSDHWVDLDLGGHAATALTAAAELARGSLEEAGRQLALARQRSPAVPAARRGRLEAGVAPRRLAAPLSEGETRVLRYLPTNLPAPEIARELSLSVNTVRTHIRHLCGKLGAHGRTEAVTQARALGLLARLPAGPEVSRAAAGRSASWGPAEDRTP